MLRIPILILDDNVSWRRALARSLERSEEFEVVGAVGLGDLALEKVRQLQPGVIVLSGSVPGSDRSMLTMLDDLKSLNPRLPIIVTSTVRERGSPQALEFLSKGAACFLPLQPLTAAELDVKTVGGDLFRDVILPKLKRSAVNTLAQPELPSAVFRLSKSVEAVAIGVSTGGPDVLVKILPELPANFPVPVFVVQHILPEFTRSLTERLQKLCQNDVREAVEGETPTAGTIWIAPSERHLEIVRSGNVPRMKLTQAPPENLCRPAADVLFRSAARTYGQGLLAVVLTGMGADGMRGCREIREAGGTVLVQDKASSVVWGMPGAVVEAGLAHEILTPAQIATELARRVARSPS